MALLALAACSIVAILVFARSGNPLNKVATTAFWGVTALWSFGVRL